MNTDSKASQSAQAPRPEAQQPNPGAQPLPSPGASPGPRTAVGVDLGIGESETVVTLVGPADARREALAALAEALGFRVLRLEPPVVVTRETRGS